MAISEFWSSDGAWNYCIGQGTFAQPGTEIFGGDLSVAGKTDDPQPEPGADGDVQQKSRCVELPAANEPGYFGQFEIQFVRNSLYRQIGDAMHFGGTGDRGPFHIHRVRAIGLRQLLLLGNADDFRIARKYRPPKSSIADWGLVNGSFVTATVQSIDDGCGENCVAHFQLWNQCAGDSGGDEEIRRIVGDYGFGGTTGRLASNSSTDHSYMLTFVEDEFAALVGSLH
jgi:hypothetical protein